MWLIMIQVDLLSSCLWTLVSSFKIEVISCSMDVQVSDTRISDIIKT